uniref:Uncharacterized protein n=1 Tax=Lepeophtheirus salmonis TaxID=72036 RepID=A0A0K2V6Y2_LEPSM
MTNDTMQGYTITHVRRMFDFHHTFNIDVILNGWLRVLSKLFFLHGSRYDTLN